MSALAGAAHLALAVLLLGYVLPGGRVIEQMAKLRAKQAPLSIEAQLAIDGLEPALPVGIDVHPELGARVHDAEGGRWLLRRGRVVAGNSDPAPAWLPDLEILVLRGEGELLRWLGDAGINPTANELARCGESECFVLGTRSGQAQLWVDKASFEVRRLQRLDGRVFELDAWQSWSGNRFPSEIRVYEGGEATGALSIEAVRPAPRLSAADLSPRWVQAAPASTP